jgi:hypothetical protein
MMHGTLVLPEMIVGVIEASATLKPDWSRPRRWLVPDQWKTARGAAVRCQLIGSKKASGRGTFEIETAYGYWLGGPADNAALEYR